MIELQFNRDIIQKIKSLNFQVDQIGSVLFVLFCLYEDRIDLLDEFDDYNKQKRAFLLYKELEMRSLVYQNEDSDLETPHFLLTKQGISLVEYIKAQFKNENKEINSEKIAVSGVETIKDAITSEYIDPEKWIDEWIEIFPKGVKSGGRLLRGDKPACIRKMRVFMIEYKYSKDEIIRATEAYIKSKAEENYAFTRCAVYFIYRVEGARTEKTSDLAAWCERVKEMETEGESQNNMEMVV